MSAPRLLDKKLIQADVATQQKQQIDTGIKLAKKVDAVRESLQEEEQNLERFRTETLKKVQIDIDQKTSERDSLERGNISLREERIRLSAPIDLSHAWQEVKDGRIEIADWKNRLTEQSIDLLAREDSYREWEIKSEKESEDLQQLRGLIERTLTEAEIKFTQASDILERAEKQSEKILSESRAIENRLAIREQEATDREVSLSKREEQVDAHEKNLSSREIKLRSRQEVFIKAQNYLKNKNKL